MRRETTPRSGDTGGPETRPPRGAQREPPTHQDLTVWEQEVRRRLDRIHETERDASRESARVAATRRELDQRQQAERKELREEADRQRRVLEARSQRADRPVARRPTSSTGRRSSKRPPRGG